MVMPVIDEILAFIERAYSMGQEPSEYMLRLGIGQFSREFTEKLLREGFASVSREIRKTERLEQKVLAVSPAYRAEVAASPEKALPSRITLLRRQRAAQVSEKVTQELSTTLTTISQAMSFYTNWILSDGTRIGDATKHTLLAEAELQKLTARGIEKNIEFYTKLAAITPDGQTVRQAKLYDQASRLKLEVFGG